MTTALLGRLRIGIVMLLALLPQAALVHAEIENRATRDRVLLVHEAEDDLVIRELVTRVRGELVAAGFTVDVVTGVDVSDARAAAESPTGDDVLARFVILRIAERRLLEVWLHDCLTSKTTVRSIRHDDRAGVLAVRVVELLRASLLELIARSSPAPAANKPTPQVTRWVQKASPPAPPPRLAHVALGLSVLQGLDQSGSSVMPTLAVQVGRRPGWSGRIIAAGLGTRPMVDAPAGSARLQQRLALAEAEWCLRLGEAGCLSLVAGVGGFHIEAEGQALSPYRAQRPASWSAATSAGVAVSWALPWHLHIAARTQAIMLWPQQLVRIAGVETARVGRPALFSGVELAVAF